MFPMESVNRSHSSDNFFAEEGNTGFSKAKPYSFSRTFSYHPLENKGLYTPIKLNRSSVLEFLEQSYKAKNKPFIEGFWAGFKKFFLSDEEISNYLRETLSGKLSNTSNELSGHQVFNDPKNLTAQRADQFARMILMPEEKPKGIDEQRFITFINMLNKDYSKYMPFSIQNTGNSIVVKGEGKQKHPPIIGILYHDKEEIGLRSWCGHLREGVRRNFSSGIVEAGLFRPEDGSLLNGIKKFPNSDVVFIEESQPKAPWQPLSKTTKQNTAQRERLSESVEQGAAHRNEEELSEDVEEREYLPETRPSPVSSPPTILPTPKSPVDIAIESLTSLVEDEQEKNQIASFVRTLASENQESFCAIVRPVLEGITGAGGRIEILRYLNNDVKKPRELCEPAAQLMNGLSSAPERLKLLKCVKDIRSGNERNNFCIYTAPLLEGISSASERLALLTFIKDKIASGDRKEFCSTVKPILEGITEADGRKQLLERIKEESAGKRKLLCEPAVKLMEGTSLADRLKLLNFAKTLPSGYTRTTFCNNVGPLLKGIANIADIEELRFVKNMPPKTGKDVCEMAKLFLFEGMTIAELSEILRFIEQLKEGERKEICKAAQPLLQEGMTAKECLEILQFAAQLADQQQAEERKKIYETLQSLLQGVTEPEKRLKILRTFVQQKPDERNHICKVLKSILNEVPNQQERIKISGLFRDILENKELLLEVQSLPSDLRDVDFGPVADRLKLLSTAISINNLSSLVLQPQSFDSIWLGAGSFGIVHALKNTNKIENLRVIMKLANPKRLTEANEDIQNEATILKAIHATSGGPFEGIQSPPHRVFSLQTRQAGYMGVRYDCDLEAFAKSGSFSPQHALQLFSGLKTLHDQKILHGDIKPANILVKKSPKECVHLADFGGARTKKHLEELFKQKKFDTMIGVHTLPYSPESMRSDESKLLNESKFEKWYRRAERRDLYSLGLSLSESISKKKLSEMQKEIINKMTNFSSYPEYSIEKAEMDWKKTLTS